MFGRAAWVLVAMWVSAGCGSHPQVAAPVAGGSVVVQFTVNAPRVDGLVLTGCQVGLEHLDLFGDVSQSPQLMLHNATLSPVQMGVQQVSFTDLPQGIYSGLGFSVESVRLEGTYAGMPLMVRFDIEGARVDLRVMPPPELTDVNDVVKLPIDVEAGVWWQGVDLTQAQLDDGRILIDPYHNPDMALSIARGMSTCFTLGTPIQ
jgi:hypothetical protein